MFPSYLSLSLSLPLAPSRLILLLCHPIFIAKFTLTSSQVIVIPRLPSSGFVLLLPSVFFFFSLNCLCFIECRCDYMGFCVCLTGVKGILSQIFPLYLYHTNTYAQTNTYTLTHTRSPLQRDVLLIGLSLVTVWEDDLSLRFLCRVVTGTSMSRE